MQTHTGSFPRLPGRPRTRAGQSQGRTCRAGHDEWVPVGRKGWACLVCDRERRAVRAGAARLAFPLWERIEQEIAQGEPWAAVATALRAGLELPPAKVARLIRACAARSGDGGVGVGASLQTEDAIDELVS